MSRRCVHKVCTDYHLDMKQELIVLYIFSLNAMVQLVRPYLEIVSIVSIESLIQDYHPAVRRSSSELIYPLAKRIVNISL